MKTRLTAELLEARETPAAGSTMIPIAVGPDFTLSINSEGRFASMQMAAPDWVAWQNGEPTQAQVQAMSQRILSYFPDQYDQIWFINNVPEVNPNSPYFGVNFGVKNEVTGIGRPTNDLTNQFGSRGELNNFIHIASVRDFYQRTGLHEFMHLSANFLPQLQSVAGGHWGFSSVNGQLGGWAPGTLQELVPAHLTQDGRGIYEADGPLGRDYFFTAFADIEDGDIPYSPLELYLLGLISADEVEPLIGDNDGDGRFDHIQYANDPEWEPGPGPSPFGIFSAASINTITMQEILAQEGLRLPTPATSQKDFKGLVIYATPNPLTQAQIDAYNVDVELFARKGSDGRDDRLNFWEATGGRATFTMEGLERFLPTRTPTVALGLENGLVATYRSNGAGGYGAGSSLQADLLGRGGFTGSIRTATGDVNMDTIPDIVVASGPGEPTRFAVINGNLSGYIIQPSVAFPGSADFTGGAFVALGDMNGDGRLDVIVTPDEGGGPRVITYAINAVNGANVISDFFGIDDPNFRGGARAAVGDVNKDGRPDLAVAAGFGGGPRVALYDGATFLSFRRKLMPDFFAFGGADATRLRNGVFLSLGDVNADGFADMVFGGGPGGAPRVTILSGFTAVTNGILAAQGSVLANFFVAGDSSNRGGVRVAVKNVDDDFRMEVLAASGEDSVSRVRVYRGSTLVPNGEPQFIQDIDPVAGVVSEGIFVG